MRRTCGAQGWLRFLTYRTRGLLGSTNGQLEPYEETVITSCEACVAAAQWATALLFMQHQVCEEYRARRRFLIARSHHFTVKKQQEAVLAWPFGSRSGICKVVIAFAAPIFVFAAAWQVWHIMLHWLVQEWHAEGHTPALLLRLPYAFASAASNSG